MYEKRKILEDVAASPRSGNAGAEEKQPCAVCDRPPGTVTCMDCKVKISAKCRVRKSCSIHPKEIFTMDLYKCPYCKSNNLEELGSPPMTVAPCIPTPLTVAPCITTPLTVAPPRPTPVAVAPVKPMPYSAVNQNQQVLRPESQRFRAATEELSDRNSQQTVCGECDRPNVTVFCGDCFHEITPARVRKICQEHPKVIYHQDFEKCPNCMGSNLLEMNMRDLPIVLGSDNPDQEQDPGLNVYLAEERQITLNTAPVAAAVVQHDFPATAIAKCICNRVISYLLCGSCGYCGIEETDKKRMVCPAHPQKITGHERCPQCKKDEDTLKEVLM